MSAVAIIDSGGANIASLDFAFRRLGINATLTTDAATIARAERVILPGVGNAKDAMDRLAKAGLIDVIRQLTQPVLGICLGMQLLFERSAEDDASCIGVIPGKAEKLAASPSLRVPNMGWCPTTWDTAHPLLNGIDQNSYFYYIHSYALPITESTVASAEHSTTFSAVAAYRNFTATQFHPERSSAAGAQLLKNFLELQACG